MTFNISDGVLQGLRGRWLAGVTFAGLMGLSGSASALSVFVDWGPVGSTPSAESSATINVGDTITANFYASDLPSSGLNAWGLEVGYSTASIFTASNADFNTAEWDGFTGFNPGSSVTANPIRAAGTVNLLPPPATPPVKTDPVRLFSVDYTGTSVGSSDFELRSVLGFDFIDGNSATIDTPTFFSTTLNVVTPVPLPATGWLMLSGLAGLAAWRRKWGAVEKQAA